MLSSSVAVTPNERIANLELRLTYHERDFAALKKTHEEFIEDFSKLKTQLIKIFALCASASAFGPEGVKMALKAFGVQ